MRRMMPGLMALALCVVYLVAGLWAADPAPAGVYPPATIKLSRIPAPKTPRPGYLEPVVDPVFKTRVVRVTDVEKTPLEGRTVLRHNYSKNQPWNCDGTLIHIAKSYLLDGGAYKVAGRYTRPSAETVWSHTDPRKMWTFDYRGRRLETINIVDDPATGQLTSSRSVVREFPDFDEAWMGRWEANLSLDDKYVAIMGRKGDDLRVLVYDIPSDKVVSEKAYPGKWPAGKEPRMDWVSMSPSGQYVVALWVDGGPGRFQGVEVFDREQNFLRQLTVSGQHGDLGRDADGNDVWVQVCCGHTDPALNLKVVYDAALVSFRLDNGSMTRVLDRTVTFGGHVSCRNYRRPGWTYVTAADGVHEAFAVKLDGSQTVERFAHTHALRTSYSAESQGVPNPEGTKFMFASNWDGDKDAPVYSYVAEFTGKDGAPELAGKTGK